MRSLQSLALLGFLGIAGQSIADEISGNYDVLVCKSACSFEQPQSVLARGIVVLSESPLPRRTVDILGLSDFVAPDEARACISGTHSKDAKTFAFLRKTTATSWVLRGGLVTFELFRSADAGYEVELGRKGNILVGKGTSWGAGVAAPHYSPDIVVARRTGPVSISACLQPAT